MDKAVLRFYSFHQLPVLSFVDTRSALAHRFANNLSLLPFLEFSAGPHPSTVYLRPHSSDDALVLYCCVVKLDHPI